MKYELELVEYDGLPVLASPKTLRERSILIWFTTRVGGLSPAPYDTLNLAGHVGDDFANVDKNRRRVLERAGLKETDLMTVEQVHGRRVVQAGDIAGREKADAIVTDRRRTPVAVFTADCVPVILANVETRKISVVHAGWKGIYSLIVPEALSVLNNADQEASGQTIAFVGPAIGPCCYEIDGERAALFNETYLARDGDKIKLDLAGAVKGQLLDAGLPVDNIALSGMCTYCRKDLFFSFRRDGKCGRQAAIAAIM